MKKRLITAFFFQPGEAMRGQAPSFSKFWICPWKWLLLCGVTQKIMTSSNSFSHLGTYGTIQYM